MTLVKDSLFWISMLFDEESETIINSNWQPNLFLEYDSVLYFDDSSLFILSFFVKNLQSVTFKKNI